MNLFLNAKNLKVKESCLSGLSSVIRGEHLEGKR